MTTAAIASGRTCPCAGTFDPAYPTQDYCSVRCAEIFQGANKLKALYENIRQRRGASHRLAERQMGFTHMHFHRWRTSPDVWLTSDTLGRLVAWIAEDLPGFDLAEAIRMQGGAGEDHKRAAMATAHAAHLDLLKSDSRKAKKYHKEWAGKLSASLTGITRSEETRGRMIDAWDVRRQRPEDLPPRPMHATARGRAHQMLRSIRYRQRDLTADQARERAIERLQELYGVPRDIARRFFEPLLRAAGRPGPKYDSERCRELQALARESGWGGLVEPPRRFRQDLAERLSKLRPDEDPVEPNAAREWLVRHYGRCRSCLVALTQLDGKTTRIPGQEVNGRLL